MSDLGYRNRSQSAVSASVNSLQQYVRDLRRAVHQPHAPYMALGVKVDDEYRQLSGNLLQIENEYYSYIRPKRTIQAGERTLHALVRGGVEYVEVRALDNSAFDPVGVNPRKLHFLEAFLQMLLLKDSPPIDASEEESIDRNHLRVARGGRAAGLTLERDGRAVALADWAAELLDGMLPVCEWLDAAPAPGVTVGTYMHSLRDQFAKLQEPERTPSARLLTELEQRGESFAALALRFSREHREQLSASGPEQPERFSELDAQAEDSLRALSQLEARQHSRFDEYLAQYLSD
jgi:glutamate--cysteine ligase